MELFFCLPFYRCPGLFVHVPERSRGGQIATHSLVTGICYHIATMIGTVSGSYMYT